jgi:hypothetical protein
MIKKPKKLTVSKIKKKAWVEFSRFVRTRDTNNLGTQCYTCGKYYDFKRMDAGHFQPGRHNIFTFDERQVHAQCDYCNRWQRGNWPSYLKHMVEDYGQEAVDQMLDDRTVVKPMKVYEYEEIYNKYKAVNKINEK